MYIISDALFPVGLNYFRYKWLKISKIRKMKVKKILNVEQKQLSGDTLNVFA